MQFSFSVRSLSRILFLQQWFVNLLYFGCAFISCNCWMAISIEVEKFIKSVQKLIKIIYQLWLLVLFTAYILCLNMKMHNVEDIQHTTAFRLNVRTFMTRSVPRFSQLVRFYSFTWRLGCWPVSKRPNRFSSSCNGFYWRLHVVYFSFIELSRL